MTEVGAHIIELEESEATKDPNNGQATVPGLVITPQDLWVLSHLMEVANTFKFQDSPDAQRQWDHWMPSTKWKIKDAFDRLANEAASQ